MGAPTARMANRLSILYGVRAFTSSNARAEDVLNDLMTTNFFGDTKARVVLASAEGVRLVNLTR